MSKAIFDGLNQEITVGDVVAMANGSYVRQEFGIVTKLGNKNNARVASVFNYSCEGGTYIDASGLVVITNLVDKLPQEKLDKIREFKSKVVLDYTRPKTSNAPKFCVKISPNLGRGWVISFQDQQELRDKAAAIEEIIGGRFEDRAGYVHRDSRSHFYRKEGDPAFMLQRYMGRKAEYELSMKSVKMLGLDGLIDDDNGFEFVNGENPELAPIDKYW
ncbi:MAG: hypothetical protein GOVbin1096_132 [Prokaryotic dsDNA virus sp.]|nr:MAG: hypothetical protein GOVbin1096_132 [Prokaryotic dsDNA virus sp.]|tara:strand:- start:34307 stop:34957 length:651 start_codon:yes stop_codon:yes gene_type:complete